MEIALNGLEMERIYLFIHFCVITHQKWSRPQPPWCPAGQVCWSGMQCLHLTTPSANEAAVWGRCHSTVSQLHRNLNLVFLSKKMGNKRNLTQFTSLWEINTIKYECVMFFCPLCDHRHFHALVQLSSLSEWWLIYKDQWKTRASPGSLSFFTDIQWDSDLILVCLNLSVWLQMMLAQHTSAAQRRSSPSNEM